MVKHLVKHPDNSLKGLYTTTDLERLFQVLTTQFYNYIRHQETQWLGDKGTEHRPRLNQINLELLFTYNI